MLTSLNVLVFQLCSKWTVYPSTALNANKLSHTLTHTNLLKCTFLNSQNSKNRTSLKTCPREMPTHPFVLRSWNDIIPGRNSEYPIQAHLWKKWREKTGGFFLVLVYTLGAYCEWAEKFAEYEFCIIDSLRHHFNAIVYSSAIPFKC